MCSKTAIYTQTVILDQRIKMQPEDHRKQTVFLSGNCLEFINAKFVAILKKIDFVKLLYFSPVDS